MRPCKGCGQALANGVEDCPHCGHTGGPASQAITPPSTQEVQSAVGEKNARADAEVVVFLLKACFVVWLSLAAGAWYATGNVNAGLLILIGLPLLCAIVFNVAKG